MKCALILLPGLDPAQQDHYRDVLVRNLVTAEESVSILERGDAGVPDERAACLQIEDGSEGGTTVHVYEAWWGDLVARPEQQTPARAILEGFQLLAYWLHPSLRPAFRRSRFLTLSLTLSSLLLLLWYVGILTAGLAGTGARVPFAMAAADPRVRLWHAGDSRVAGLLFGAGLDVHGDVRYGAA